MLSMKKRLYHELKMVVMEAFMKGLSIWAKRKRLP